MEKMRAARLKVLASAATAALFCTAIPALAAPGDDKHAGDAPATVMYLERDGGNFVLAEASEGHKGGNHTEIDLGRRGLNFALYQELGVWSAKPAAAAARVIDIAEAELWLRTDGTKQAGQEAQLFIEVLKNGAQATFKETGCIALPSAPTLPVSIDIPAPFPAIELNPGDVLSVRISARSGLGGGCSVNMPTGKARLEFGSSERPSSVTFAFGGAGPGAEGIGFEGGGTVVGGVFYITPQTVITSQILADSTLTLCIWRLTHPAGLNVSGMCAPGETQLTGIPAQDPALGTYKLHLTAIAPDGTQREEMLEFYCVETLP